MSCMAKGYLKGNGKAMQHSIVLYLLAVLLVVVMHSVFYLHAK